jgi:transcriptional regulator with GAF, ATPase, and Fis domain
VWRQTLARAVEVACYSEAAILLTGESGTGKELIARFVHDVSGNAMRPFEIVDCTTINSELAGSELFGHERGAFTGAHSARDGAAARADGGTLFLDEIGDLPAALQPQLLRVLQERTYRRVGGNAWLRANFRLVVATHRDLTERVRCGRFRADLYHRVAAIPLVLPPLRDRVEDILLLTRHFLVAAAAPRKAPPLDRSVEDFLLARYYPGNVRELRQLSLRLLLRWPMLDR